MRKICILVALKTKEILDQKFGEDYEYVIWHKNGRHDVEVNQQGVLYKFQYADDGDQFTLEEVEQKQNQTR